MNDLYQVYVERCVKVKYDDYGYAIREYARPEWEKYFNKFEDAKSYSKILSERLRREGDLVYVFDRRKSLVVGIVYKSEDVVDMHFVH